MPRGKSGKTGKSDEGIAATGRCNFRMAAGTFPEYHTSADNLSVIHPEHLGESYRKVWDVVQELFSIES